MGNNANVAGSYSNRRIRRGPTAITQPESIHWPAGPQTRLSGRPSPVCAPCRRRGRDASRVYVETGRVASRGLPGEDLLILDKGYVEVYGPNSKKGVLRRIFLKI